MSAILPFLNAILPTSLAIGGLSKLDPRMQKFLAYSSASGFSTEQALDFLRKKVQAPGEIAEQHRLSQGEQQGSLRPDERAAQQRIQESNRIPSALSKGIATGVGAIAGLSSMDNQPNPDQQQTQEEAQPQQQPERQYEPFVAFSKFPELMKFAEQESAAGGNAQSIASKARKSVRLRTFVNTIEQEIGEPFENLLARLIGGGGQQQAAQPSQAAPQGQDRLARLAAAMEAYNSRKR